MNRPILALAGATVLTLAAVASVAAADPTPAPAATPAPVATPSEVNRGVMIPAILGLDHDALMALRQQGLTLAQVAERQQVDPQVLIDALAAQWTVRIEQRLALGALTADQAETLRAEVAVRAKAFVNQVPLGGMGRQAVGAGPAAGAGNGIHAPGTGSGQAGARLGGGRGFGGGRGMQAAAP
jgi:hypothetical protein